MEKYHHDDITPIERENERDENYKGTNEQIDSTRTKNNIHLVKRDNSYLGYVNQRIEELGCRTKKDTVLMCGMVVGASPEFFEGLPPDLIKEYFRQCAMFFVNRYGKDNIVSAVIHLDETTPHMHLNLIPELDGRLCCKHLFDRNALRQLQTDIYEQVGKDWGLKRGEEGSKRKHIETAEYKAKKIVQNAVIEASEIEQRTAAKQQEYREADINLSEAIAKRKAEEQIVASLSTQKQSLAKEIDNLTEAKIAADQPIPLFGKNELITSLRVENAQLKQDVESARKDQTEMYLRLQKIERKANTGESAIKMISEMQTAFPDEFECLLKKSRAKLQPQPKKTSSNYNSKR